MTFAPPPDVEPPEPVWPTWWERRLAELERRPYLVILGVLLWWTPIVVSFFVGGYGRSRGWW